MEPNSPLRISSHKLPLEIWQHIFTDACTDGGPTGTSLALVSRFFHYASHPIRFRSLSFASLSQIQGFLAYVQGPLRVRGTQPPKVHHLMLSFSNPHPYDLCQEHSQSFPDTSNVNTNAWFMARQMRETEKATWDKRFHKAVSNLFNLAGPYLETLCLVQSDVFAIPAIRPIVPNLRELTLLIGISVMLNEDEDEGELDHRTLQACRFSSRHPDTPLSVLSSSGPLRQGQTTIFGQEVDGKVSAPTPATSVTPSSGDTAPPSGRFPSLNRLHIVCGRHRDWTLRTALEPLPRLAPALTHLRISNVAYTHGQDDCIPAFLHRALRGRVSEPAHGGLQSHSGPAPTEIAMDDAVVPRRHRAEGAYYENAAPAALTLGGGEDQARSPPQETVTAALAPGAKLLPALRHVVVHSVPPPPGYRSGAPYEDYCALVDAVKEVAAACDEGEGGGVWVQWWESERAQNRAWEQLIKAQWVDRCEGGRGCWESDESVRSMAGASTAGFLAKVS